MDFENRQKIEKLASESIREIAEHACQDEVISQHIRKIKNNLSEILNMCQAEQSEPSVTSLQRSRLEESEKSDILRIAYAMSRFDYPFLNNLLGTSYNQSGAFNYLEKLTGVKATTLKNMRDRFDPYVKQKRSNRRGWHQVQLLLDYQEVKDRYDNCNEETIAIMIKQIVDKFRSKD